MRTVKIRTTQNIDIEYQIAGVGNRIFAYLLDYVILLAVFLVLFAIGYFLTEVVGLGGGGYLNPFSVIVFFAVVIGVFYDLACEILLNGQSIGKRILNLKVVRLDGAKPTLGNYLLRWLLRLVDFSISSGFVGLITVAATEYGQRVGDLAAGTTVISLNKLTNFEETIFEEVEENYTVKYPQVNLLSDKDIHLIKDVLKQSENVENNEIILKLFKKVKGVLGVTTDEAPKKFIKTVLKDYNHLNSDFEI